MTFDIAAAIAEVRGRIEAAAQRSGRDPRKITLVAVSKTYPAETIRQAMAAGLNVFGENRVQEAEAKIGEIGRDVRWHLIGHLQSNKARKAVQLIDVIHSLDSVELAERLERICLEEGRNRLDVLVQVDLAGEAAKSGVTEADLPLLTKYLATCKCLLLKGFMLMPPFFEDAEDTRPYFRHLREIRDEMLPGGELSMGMSHDLEVAIEEGATMVRVGTSIFGRR